MVPDVPEIRRWFDDRIFRNADICSHCFRRIKADHRRVEWGDPGHDKVTPTTDGGEVINPEIATYPPRTVCQGCGSVAGRADRFSKSTADAVACVDRIVDRLADQGIDAHRGAARRAIRRLKSLEGHQGSDTEMFAIAAYLGVKYGRDGDRPRDNP